MGKILIIDDTQFWRDITSDVLRGKGHTVFTAADGVDGLSALQAHGADLIVLDIEMPRLTGLSFLNQLRRDDHWKNLPVIMLTGDMIKNDILHAKKLGAVDYMLKSRFDVQLLADRVQKRLGPSGPPVATAPSAIAQAAARAISPPGNDADDSGKISVVPRLLTADQSIKRAEHAMKGRALSSVAAKIIAYIGSPTMELGELADLISRDSMLAVRVLQTANSAAYTSSRGTVSAVADAVRIIGSDVVREIAASAALFECMPQPGADGFNPIEGWQHALAVAILCNHLATDEQRGVAYVVGLCHNLGEILFRSHFGAEYRQLLETERVTHIPRRELERQMLGISRGQLVERILEKLELPPAIRTPIVAYHRATNRAAVTEPLARLLWLADEYATALMLRPSDEKRLQPITRVDCRLATASEDPTPPGSDEFRSELAAMKAMFGQITASAHAGLADGLPRRRPIRICLARDPVFSAFDPIAAALEVLADVTIRPSLPMSEELSGYDGLIVEARTPAIRGFTWQDLAGLPTNPDVARAQTLWIVGSTNNNHVARPGEVEPTVWPISPNLLIDFVKGL